MGRVLRILLAGAVLLSLASMAEAKTITIKAVTAWPKSVWEVGNFTKFLDIVKERVAQKYPGQLEIQYAGGPEVIPNQEQVEAARMGVVDMVFTTDGYYVSAVPEVNALSVSMLDGWEERAKGVNAFLDKIHQEKVSCIYLGRLGHNLPFTIYLTKPVKGLEDLKGLKIRCSPTLIGFLKKIGANPVVIAPPEVYTALERGVVDGINMGVATYSAWKLWGVMPHMVKANLFYGNINYMINKRKFDALSPADQAALLAAARESEVWLKPEYEKSVDTSIADAVKQGGTVTTLPLARSKAMVDSIAAKWKGEVDSSCGPELAGNALGPRKAEKRILTKRPVSRHRQEPCGG